MDILTDESIMPLGIHQGKKMINVPAEYLLFMYEKKNFYGKEAKEVQLYITNNLEILKEQRKKNYEKKYGRIQ